MNVLKEFDEIFIAREAMYSFLASIYNREVDQKTYNALKSADLPQDIDNDMASGYADIFAYIQSAPLDPITDLSVDYAKVLLGAGATDTSNVAFPFESVYTSSKRLIMQDARDKVLKIYRDSGVDVDQALNTPEDHIAIELEFMNYLANKSKDAYNAGKKDEFIALMTKQLTFIENHLLNWVPKFCDDMEKFANTIFYKGIAKITKAYLLMDSVVIKELISEC